MCVIAVNISTVIICLKHFIIDTLGVVGLKQSTPTDAMLN